MEAEGPIHMAQLGKLVCVAFDLNKVNDSRAASVVKLADRNMFHVDRDGFVWPTSLDPGPGWATGKTTSLKSERLST